jgi:hypothetical protein
MHEPAIVTSQRVAEVFAVMREQRDAKVIAKTSERFRQLACEHHFIGSSCSCANSSDVQLKVSIAGGNQSRWRRNGRNSFSSHRTGN